MLDGKTLFMPCATHPEKLDDEDPCWEGYEMVGWKMKNGKKVPNCVPKESLAREENLESYADYPDSVKNNAKRGIRKNERGGNKCGTQTGKVRAQQLADGEAISVETIKRMYSFLSRHERNYDPSDSTSCGTISYLLWGGKAALGWSRNKLRELGELD